MSEQFVLVPDTGTKKAHFNQRTIGADNMLDEFVVPGEYPYATFRVTAALVSGATALSHLLQIMAGASLAVRLRRLRLVQDGVPAAVALSQIQLFRLSTAGTGGTAITPRPADTADTAGATAMTLPTVKGTEGVQLDQDVIWYGTAAIPGLKNVVDWVPSPACKPIIIPAGVANGLAVKTVGGVAASSVSILAEFVETSFV